MKKFLFTLVVIALCACEGNQPTDLANHNLVGRVKSVRIYTYNKSEKRFGEWEPIGEPDATCEYTYNKKGMQTEYKHFVKDSLCSHEVAESSKEADISYHKGWLSSYKNDSVEIITVFSKDIPERTTIKVKDEVIFVVAYRDVIDCNNYTSFQYDSDGIEVLEKRVVENGNVIELSNAWSKRTAYAKYDDKGNITDSKNAYVSNLGIIWGVDDYGPEETTQYSYTYDTEGNWIKRVELVERTYLDPCETIVTRKIEYW